MLGLSLHGWENSMVVFLIVAGGFALLAGAATWAVVRLQRIEIAESNEALERYKIDAGSALESTKVEVARANESSERIKNETARLQSENLALQTVLLPRHVGLYGGPDGPAKADTWFAPMAEFDTVSFAIQPVNDAEARSLAEEIMIGLAFVGIRASIDEGMVTVNPTNAGEGVSVSFPTGNPLLERAGNSLADALTKAGLGVGDMPVFRRGGIPPDPKDIASGLVNPIHKGVVVAVGQRPVSLTVAWLNRERSRPAGNPAAANTDAK
jgi:hypothetical protein